MPFLIFASVTSMMAILSLIPNGINGTMSSGSTNPSGASLTSSGTPRNTTAFLYHLPLQKGYESLYNVMTCKPLSMKYKIDKRPSPGLKEYAKTDTDLAYAFAKTI